MDNSEPLVHFGLESTEVDDEPLLQLQSKEKDSDDKDVQPRLNPEVHTLTTRQKISSGARGAGVPHMRVLLILLVVVAVAALCIALLGIILAAVGLNKSGTTSSSDTTKTTTMPPTLSPTTNPPGPPLVSNKNCGDGLWNRIAFLNMSDPSQQCPRGWRGYDQPVRCCGRPVIGRSSCPSVYFPTNGYQYTKVCGRAFGYQQGSPDGFSSSDSGEVKETINGIYVDGVSVTHGNPRTHIWTFAVGLLENGTNDVNNQHRCPCDGGENSPDFVQNNYFCETGNHDSTHDTNRFYDEDQLWNGKGCEQSTCCTFNSPPWFKVQLPNSTVDDLEVRICGDQSTADEDSPIALLEIYVQQ